MKPFLAIILVISMSTVASAQELNFPPLDAPIESEPLPPPEGFPSDVPQDDPFPAPEAVPETNDAAPAQTTPPVAAVPAERVKNKVAEFSGIDKITGRITSFDVYIDETVQFGALQVTPKVCYTSPASEAARTDSYVEVDEITLDREIRRIFSGWMFSDSPGLNAVEHPVYDVWLKGCKTDSTVPPPAG